MQKSPFALIYWLYQFFFGTATWLAQLVERQSAVREVEGSSPRPDQPTRTNKSARIRTINRRPRLLHRECYMVSRGR